MMELGCSRHSPWYFVAFWWMDSSNSWTLMTVDSGQHLFERGAVDSPAWNDSVGGCNTEAKVYRPCRFPAEQSHATGNSLGDVNTDWLIIYCFDQIVHVLSCVLFISILLKGLYLNRPLQRTARLARPVLFSPRPLREAMKPCFLKNPNINFTRTLRHLQAWREFQGVADVQEEKSRRGIGHDWLDSTWSDLTCLIGWSFDPLAWDWTRESG